MIKKVKRKLKQKKQSYLPTLIFFEDVTQNPLFLHWPKTFYFSKRALRADTASNRWLKKH